MENININLLAYRVGGLLYMSALLAGISEKIRQGLISCLSSIALCLEDTVQDGAAEQAEATLFDTLRVLAEGPAPKEGLPLIFIRPRTPEQMERIHNGLGDRQRLITGYIFPKFDLSSAEDWLKMHEKLAKDSPSPLYFMPILESRMVADALTRVDTLTKLRSILDDVRPYVLNVRVGGNDFSNLYGLRRNVDQTIYDLCVIRDILMDILNIFGQDYVVSGPVWNYYGVSEDEAWAKGLERELALDRLNGFLGKTAIHPCQLPIIRRSLSVSREDYDDACAILNWSSDKSGVARSVAGNRMNELNCHGKWARRTKILGDIYGIRSESDERERGKMQAG
ncbi:HpcH/HpaI aldolase/citrate lyase family protein [bacterium]|nr:HpcH/HpaI aldolase/citrate lyase family protein [bacterium]